MNRQDEKLKAGDTEAAQRSTVSGTRRRFRRSIIALSLAAVLGISTISARILSIPAIAPVQRAHALGDGLMQNGMMIMLIMMLMGMMRNNNNNGSQPVPNNSLNNNQQPLPAGPLQPSLPGSGSNGSANPLLVGAPFIGGVQAIGNLMNPQPSTQPNTQPSTQPNVQPNTPSNPQQASSGQNGAFAAVGSANPSKPASTNQGTSPAAAPSNALSGSSATKPSTQAQPQTQEQQNGIFQKI